MRHSLHPDPGATEAFVRLGNPAPVVDASSPCKAVVIGGGTGAPVSIRTLLSMGMETSAVVAMADDGGSTGILREEAGVTPPGDIRKCIAAFAADADDPFTKAFKYRFEFARNHTLGNLMLSALEDATDSFPEAIAICEDLLHARGHVYPSTLDKIELCGVTRDGTNICGQARLSHSHTALSRVWLDQGQAATAYQPALDAILDADLIVLGPGSLYTSIIPNLLVPGIIDAIRRSKGKTIFTCSLADMQGETWGMTAQEHFEAIVDHGMAGLVDYVLIHSPVALRPGKTVDASFDALVGSVTERGRHVAPQASKSYIRPVQVDYAAVRAIQKQGPMVIVRNLVDPKRPTWHNPAALIDAYTGVLKLCHSPQM